MISLKHLPRTDLQVVEDIWQAGFVNRWHSYPDARLRNSQDTTAAHSHRVATLVAFLSPKVALQDVLHALWHDTAERWVGDVPLGAKNDSEGHPTRLGVAVAEAEDSAWRKLEVGTLAASGIVRLCDRLDSYLFVQMVAPDLLHDDDWSRSRARIVALADELGVLDRVSALLG